MKEKLTILNNKIAIKLTYFFGTMSMFWMAFVWAILPLIPALSSYKDMILYVSAGIIQLVALPLIMVGSKLLSQQPTAKAIGLLQESVGIPTDPNNRDIDRSPKD